MAETRDPATLDVVRVDCKCRPVQEIYREIEELARREDECALQMGDLLIELEDQYGVARRRYAVERAGIGEEKAKQRMWVSRRIPKGHAARNLGLRFTHLRTLAVLHDSAEISDWAARTAEHGWSVKALLAELKAAGKVATPLGSVTSGSKAALGTLETGDRSWRCLYCRGAISPESEEAVFVSNTSDGERGAGFCGLRCAVVHLHDLYLSTWDPTGDLRSTGALDCYIALGPHEDVPWDEAFPLAVIEENEALWTEMRSGQNRSEYACSGEGDGPLFDGHEQITPAVE